MRLVLSKLLASFRHDEGGPTATEYAVMLAFICVAAIVSFSTFGDLVLGIWTAIADAVDAV